MVRDLARDILAKEVDTDRLKAAEKAASWHDARLWSTLADAGLLGIAVDEAHGGMGLGLLELCTLLEEIGRVVAPVHVLPALVLGGLPIAEHGTAEQKQRWLAALARGEAILTGAFGTAMLLPTRSRSRKARRFRLGADRHGSLSFPPPTSPHAFSSLRESTTASGSFSSIRVRGGVTSGSPGDVAR